MTRFAEIREALSLPPADSILIPVECFAHDWHDRPSEPVPVGLRPVSEDNNNWARREASKDAQKAHGNHPVEVWIEAYNGALMRYRLVQGLCDPIDGRRAWDLWRGVGQAAVHTMFNAAGVAWLYAELERVEAEYSPARAQADDDEIQDLVDLAPDALERMPAGKRARIRRLLRFCLDECRTA